MEKDCVLLVKRRPLDNNLLYENNIGIMEYNREGGSPCFQ